MAKKYDAGIKVLFPRDASIIKAQEALKEIEERAINTIEYRMKHDIARLTPYQWDKPGEHAYKEALIRSWAQEAHAQANSGRNWSYNGASRSYTLNFQSNAYNQALFISATGQW